MKWQATNWVSSAPTTVIEIVDGQQVVIAECSGHGKDSKLAVEHARQIVALRAAAEDALVVLQAKEPPALKRANAIDALRRAIANAGG